MSDEFKYNEEIFVSFFDEKNIQRDGWYYVVEIGQTAVTIKAKSGNIIFIPISRILKIKKKGGNHAE